MSQEKQLGGNKDSVGNKNSEPFFASPQREREREVANIKQEYVVNNSLNKNELVNTENIIAKILNSTENLESSLSQKAEYKDKNMDNKKQGLLFLL